MTETPTHAVFTVRVADHEQGADRTAWRIRHATETFSLVFAWFTRDGSGSPVQADDGTFEVHAPSRTTLDTLRQMFEHEALTIVTEDEVPGVGLLVAVDRD